MSDLDFTNKLFVEYLQRRLDRTAVPGHWLSTGSLFAKGDRHYGILKLDGKRYYAHRAIWEWKTGKEPLGLIRLTSECKYELCVRPEHLWEVADAETATEPACLEPAGRTPNSVRHPLGQPCAPWLHVLCSLYLRQGGVQPWKRCRT